MRARMLALVATALAIAACNDASSPTALGSTDGSTVVAPQAHFAGPSHSDTKTKHDSICHEQYTPDAHRYVYKHRGYGWYWDYSRDRHHHLHRVLRREPLPKHVCPPPADSTPPDTTPSNTPGSVTGTVMNDGVGAVGFTVALLSPDGVDMLSIVNTDGTGTFNITSVPAGSYLLCEADPFTDQWGFLGQTRPNAGPSCPASFAPLGFTVTVTAGATSSGFAFSNMQLN